MGLAVIGDSDSTACGISRIGASASGLRYNADSAARRAVRPGSSTSLPATLALFHSPKARLAACQSPALWRFRTVDPAKLVRLSEWLDLEQGRADPYLNFYAFCFVPRFCEATEYWDLDDEQGADESDD
jgi:hypothetical protein